MGPNLLASYQKCEARIPAVASTGWGCGSSEWPRVANLVMPCNPMHICAPRVGNSSQMARQDLRICSKIGTVRVQRVPSRALRTPQNSRGKSRGK
jgi:hypothetical protein